MLSGRDASVVSLEGDLVQGCWSACVCVADVR